MEHWTKRKNSKEKKNVDFGYSFSFCKYHYFLILSIVQLVSFYTLNRNLTFELSYNIIPLLYWFYRIFDSLILFCLAIINLWLDQPVYEQLGEYKGVQPCFFGCESHFLFSGLLWQCIFAHSNEGLLIKGKQDVQLSLPKSCGSSEVQFNNCGSSFLYFTEFYCKANSLSCTLLLFILIIGGHSLMNCWRKRKRFSFCVCSIALCWERGWRKISRRFNWCMDLYS